MLIAHIGRGKCGSSSLQNALYTQRLQLLDRGLYVPETAYSGNHYELYNDLISDAGPQIALSDVAESLCNPAYTCTVVSSEFFLDLDEKSIQKLVDAIPRGAIRAIIYLRDYVDWFPSLYSQKTKNGRLKHDFDWYFESEFKNKVSIIPQVELWISCIGAENLLVRQMQDGFIEGNSIERDMGLQIGADLAEAERRNISPHWWAVEFRRAIATIVPSADRATQQAISFAMGQFDAKARDKGIGPARYLTEQQSIRLRDLYRSDIAALRQLIGHPAAEQVSRSAPLRKGAEPPNLAMVPADEVSDVAETCARRFGTESPIVWAMHTLLNQFMSGAPSR